MNRGNNRLIVVSTLFNFHSDSELTHLPYTTCENEKFSILTGPTGMFHPDPLLATFGLRNAPFVLALGSTREFSPGFKFLFFLVRHSICLFSAKRPGEYADWCYSLRVQTISSTWPSLTLSLTGASLVRPAVCILLEKADCCENLSHTNKTALALSDTIASNLSLITSGTQLHQLKNHLVNNEDLLAWWIAKCPSASGASSLASDS